MVGEAKHDREVGNASQKRTEAFPRRQELYRETIGLALLSEMALELSGGRAPRSPDVFDPAGEAAIRIERAMPRVEEMSEFMSNAELLPPRWRARIDQNSADVTFRPRDQRGLKAFRADLPNFLDVERLRDLPDGDGTV